jgi:hypothetical protein
VDWHPPTHPPTRANDPTPLFLSERFARVITTLRRVISAHQPVSWYLKFRRVFSNGGGLVQRLDGAKPREPPVHLELSRDSLHLFDDFPISLFNFFRPTYGWSWRRHRRVLMMCVVPDLLKEPRFRSFNPFYITRPFIDEDTFDIPLALSLG